jgi:hypothetical protein
VFLDLSALDEATLAELNDLVPMYEELIHTSKVHLLQSLVSRILVQTVFGAYYVGLSDEQTNHFRQMEKLLDSFGTSQSSSNYPCCADGVSQHNQMRRSTSGARRPSPLSVARAPTRCRSRQQPSPSLLWHASGGS